jgi:hypothetical protein
MCYDREVRRDCNSLWIRVTAVTLDDSWRSVVQNGALLSVGAAFDLFASLEMLLVWVEVWDSFLCAERPNQPVPLIGESYAGKWRLDNWADGFHVVPSTPPGGPFVAYWIGPSDTRSVAGGFDMLLYASENYYSGRGIGATGRVIFTCTWVEDAE